jgi:branched-chain amino acid transport system ATP-binding protein
MLEISGLAVAYGRSEAVHGVDFSVGAGETVCLLGANGAGKTTILRALCGLVRAHRGSVRLNGTEILGRRAHWIAAHGMVQVPEGRQVFATLTVADNLELGGWCVTGRADRARRRDSMLDRFPRLRDRLHQLAGSLSGGEQQMLAIGRALMAAPRVLLLDEPSMGLAPRFVEEVFATIAQLRGDGVTILLVEQNASAALKIADRAYVLETGRIALAGPAAQVANDPGVMAAYLGA